MVKISSSEQDTKELRRLADQASGVQGQRLRAVLLAAEGRPVEAIATEVQLRPRQVAYWIKQYNRQGLDLFVDEAADGDHEEKSAQKHKPSAKAAPGISADDSMSEAGRKIFAHYYAQMVGKEDDVRAGTDGEAVHDMRVATRRLRSALRIFGAFYHGRTFDDLGKELRRVASALGAVRDLEVVRQKAAAYASALSTADQEAFQPLLNDWDDQRIEARTFLLETLDSRRYARLLQDVEAFLVTTDHDVAIQPPAPYLVRHVIPDLIYRRYTAVRAYEPILFDAPLDTLHALRIDAKRLRYTLETFEEALGSEAKLVIETTKDLQDHLGALQDARVTGNLIYDFLEQAGESYPVTAILQYLTYCEGEKQRLVVGIRPAWAAFTRDKVKNALGLAVAVL